MKQFVVFFILILILAGCGEQSFYTEKKEFPDGVWNINEPAEFDFEITEPDAGYFVFFDIESSPDYATSNLWLFLDIKSPSGTVQTDTVEYDMADETGKWVGKDEGDIVFTKLLYKANIRFPEKGIYQFNIRQGMRKNQLPLINSFALRIEKTNNEHN